MEEKQPLGGPKTDQDAHHHAMRAPIAVVAGELTELLGATTVAVIGGVNETRAVQQWAAGREPQRAHVLRFALQLATMIATVADRDVARAWFHGTNPRLQDRTPMLLLRHEPLDQIQGPLMEAARVFAAHA